MIMASMTTFATLLSISCLLHKMVQYEKYLYAPIAYMSNYVCKNVYLSQSVGQDVQCNYAVYKQAHYINFNIEMLYCFM